MVGTSPQTLPNFHEGTIDAKAFASYNGNPLRAIRRFFQIAKGNGRQACSVQTKFPTQQQASRYLRQNWNKIEQMARDCLAKGTVEEGRINFVMIEAASRARSASADLQLEF